MLNYLELQNKLEQVVAETATELPENFRKKMVEDLDLTLGKRIDAETLNMLSEDDLTMYEEVLKEDGMETAYQFAAEIIPDYSEKIEQIINQFIDDYRRDMGKE